MLIQNSNINPKRHLNRSRPHLNDTGVSVLIRNFRNFLTDFEWQIDQGIQNNISSPSMNGANEGIFCKSSYQIYIPIEIRNFMLRYHEGNNSAKVYYGLADPSKISSKRITSLKVKQVHFFFVEVIHSDTFRTCRWSTEHGVLENMQAIHLTWSWWILPTTKDFHILNFRFVT